MLADLHRALQQLLHERGLIPPEDVDVRFEAPRREWVSSLYRPTIDFFLFDVQENTDLRHTNLPVSRTSARATYRVPPRRFDLRYLVTALTTEVEDEHLLLWRTLLTLLRHPELPTEFLPAPLRALAPPIVSQIKLPSESDTLLDVWGGLEGPPHPSLLYVVTVPVDLEIAIQAPLVLTRTARYTRVGNGGAAADTRVHVGGVVRDREGRSLPGAVVTVEGSALPGVSTNPAGEFVLPGLAPGAVTLRVSRPGAPVRLVEVEIPSEFYEIVVD